MTKMSTFCYRLYHVLCEHFLANLPQAELGEGGHWTNLGVDALMDVVLLHKVWKTKLKSLAKLDQSNG